MNHQLFLFINSFAGRNHFLDSIMVFCASYLVYLVFVIMVAFVAYSIYKKQWKPFIYFFATLVVGFLLLQLVALINFDHRPFMDYHVTQLVAHAAGSSFPSDHTTVVTAIAAGFLFFTRFKKLGALLLIMALVIGFARVFVGIHYPADIAGGIVTGLLGGSIVLVAKYFIDKPTRV